MPLNRVSSFDFKELKLFSQKSPGEKSSAFGLLCLASSVGSDLEHLVYARDNKQG